MFHGTLTGHTKHTLFLRQKFYFSNPIRRIFAKGNFGILTISQESKKKCDFKAEKSSKIQIKKRYETLDTPENIPYNIIMYQNGYLCLLLE